MAAPGPKPAESLAIRWMAFGGSLFMALLLTGVVGYYLLVHVLEPAQCSPTSCPGARGVVIPLVTILTGWLIAMVFFMGLAVRFRPW